MAEKHHRNIKIASPKSHQVRSIKLDPNVCDANNDGKIDKKYLKMEKLNRDLLCPTKNSKGKDIVIPRPVGLFGKEDREYKKQGWVHFKRVKDLRTVDDWVNMERRSHRPLEFRIVPVNQGGMEIKLNPSLSKFKPFAYDIHIRTNIPQTVGRYGYPEFERPGSALRRASKSNPRRHPCPTCGTPNCLTDKDKAKGYQCDRCADGEEGNLWGER